jgi:hypothetical protein
MGSPTTYDLELEQGIAARIYRAEEMGDPEA